MKAEKVKYEVNKWTNLPVSYCPYCGKRVDMYLYGRPDELVKYCPFCGQALDWGETKE